MWGREQELNFISPGLELGHPVRWASVPPPTCGLFRCLFSIPGLIPNIQHNAFHSKRWIRGRDKHRPSPFSRVLVAGSMMWEEHGLYNLGDPGEESLHLTAPPLRAWPYPRPVLGRGRD